LLRFLFGVASPGSGSTSGIASSKVATVSLVSLLASDPMSFTS
jgi:hypothetical protein